MNYKRIVIEFDRYLKETNLIYAIDVFAVFNDMKDNWEAIKRGEFVFLDSKEGNKKC